MKTLISILLFFNVLTFFSQNMTTYSISVIALGSATGEQHEIQIIKGEGDNFVIVKKLKKEMLPIPRRDSLEIMELLSRNDRDSRDAISALIEKTRVYDIDSLQISQENKLIKISDSFFKNRNQLLRKLEENRDKRIILDGTSISVKISNSENHPITLYAQSPTKESHPEIYEFLYFLRKTYMDESANPILD